MNKKVENESHLVLKLNRICLFTVIILILIFIFSAIAAIIFSSVG